LAPRCAGPLPNWKARRSALISFAPPRLCFLLAEKSLDDDTKNIQLYPIVGKIEIHQPVGMAESDDIRSAIATLKASCDTAPAVR
jgi:hypothetical protein